MTAVDADREAWAASLVADRDQPPARTPIRDRLLSLKAMQELPPTAPLVDGLLYRNTIAQISGAPGSYKTFIVVGLACSVAIGRAWEGHRVPVAGPVLFVAAEGAADLPARIHAWAELSALTAAEWGLLEANLLVLPQAIQLADSRDVDELTALAKDLGALLLVLDTRARCTIGLSENDATEQSRAIEAAEGIKRDSGATVLVIHHSGRSGEHGRGSNAWDGAVHSDLRLKGAELRAQLHCEKHKDTPAGCDHHYRLIPHQVSETALPRRDDEDPRDWATRRSTLVAVQTGDLDILDGDRMSTRNVLDIIRTKAGPEGLTRPQIITIATEQGLARSTVYDAIATLYKTAAIRNTGTQSRARYIVAGQATLTQETP